MKKIALGFWLISLAGFGQSEENPCEILSKIQRLIVAEHYKAKSVDDSLSVFVFEKWMAELDPHKNIFLKTEYDALSKHKLKIDNYVFQKNCGFIAEVAETYKNALLRTKKTIDKIRPLPMNYSSGDTVRFYKDAFPFYVKENEIEKVFIKRLKYEILEDIAKSGKNLDSINQNFEVIEKKSHQKIFDANICKIDNRLSVQGGIESNIASKLFDIFCKYFDPHTSYFSYDAKSSFVSDLSTNNLSLGINVRINENEELFVENVVPGSPASSETIIEKGDQILKLLPKNGAELLVSCTSLETIGGVIRSDNYKEVTIFFRKKDGKEYDVTLEKKLMKADEHSVYSMILKRGSTRAGYIRIPSFYTDFENSDNGGVADDVLKEIIKLKNDNINGLIIDLQNDGGGSMDEAVKLAGLFIDHGAVSVSVDNRKRQRILRDFNRGTAFNGNIIILVNGNSASASELFAAAMQDYNRALIVGSNTHGKSTMQQIFPVTEDNKNFVKLTIGKFYRVNGTSHQQTGVIPDINIPQLYDKILKRESTNEMALSNDVIKVSAKFKPYQNAFKNVILKSNLRIDNDLFLNQIVVLNKELEEVYNNQKAPVSISVQNVFMDFHQTDSLFDKIKELSEKQMDFELENTSHQKTLALNDTFQAMILNERKKELLTNYTANEALNILADFEEDMTN
ncbi:peptidase S41 [Flavobacterium sp. NST-5]|uniref:Peptidase S41 n=1 Tax=Flavobacterium ichthyis TaxID=2698827 RepID=A0ABW9Z8A0_9FLAO|nr:S41 family peptidase [Flavobacterium ichthyis]NBL65095.1 peptidase S41 [Flavobacterium ichthyis]